MTNLLEVEPEITWRDPGSALTREPYVTHATNSQVSLRWQTVFPTKCQVTLDGRTRFTSGTVHRQTFLGLSAGTDYPYTVKVRNGQVFSGTAHTPPLTGLVKIVVIGDSGVGGAEQSDVAKQIATKNADFLLHTGDLVYPVGARDKYDPYYFNMYGPIISRSPWYHVLSEHDVDTDDGAPHWENFDKPGVPFGVSNPAQKNYKVRIANIEVFLLHVPRLGTYVGLDTGWLDSNLLASTADWKLVVVSSPIYSTGTTWTSDTGLRTLVESIYVSRGVDLTFSGHQHSYQRTTAVNAGVAGSGPMHIVTGGGGQALYTNGTAQSWTAFQSSSFHYVYLEINGLNLTGFCIDRAGTQLETWTLTT